MEFRKNKKNFLLKSNTKKLKINENADYDNSNLIISLKKQKIIHPKKVNISFIKIEIKL